MVNFCFSRYTFLLVSAILASADFENASFGKHSVQRIHSTFRGHGSLSADKQ